MKSKIDLIAIYQSNVWEVKVNKPIHPSYSRMVPQRRKRTYWLWRQLQCFSFNRLALVFIQMSSYQTSELACDRSQNWVSN